MQVKLIGGSKDGVVLQITHEVPELVFPRPAEIAAGKVKFDREVYRLAKLNPGGDDEYHFDRVERVHSAHLNRG